MEAVLTKGEAIILLLYYDQLHPDDNPLQNSKVLHPQRRQEKTSSEGFGNLFRGRITNGRSASKERDHEVEISREIEIVAMHPLSCPRAR